jgi:hypothetical protein
VRKAKKFAQEIKIGSRQARNTFVERKKRTNIMCEDNDSMTMMH